jgi:hypothetical protein
MEGNTFQECIDYLHERLSQLPDKREGANSYIKIKDFGLSAFSVFLCNRHHF